MSAENITSFNKLYNEYYDRFVRFANVYKIAAALKPLRDRVGMPAVDFDREYNTASDHPFKDLDKYIQAVRRERRVETAYGNKLVYDQAANNNLFLSGKPGDAKRYIIPFNNKNYQNGWQFKLDRDYLYPIQSRMLSLTNNQWKQNPGW